MTVALPIIPHRYRDEAYSSWLNRVADVYDMTAHDLLDVWTVRQSKWFLDQPSVESRFDSIAIGLIAERVRLPAQSMIADGVNQRKWLVSRARDVPVCPICLLEDDLNRRDRYRRYQWNQSWRVSCHIHRNQDLIRLDAWKSASLEPWNPWLGLRHATGNLARTRNPRYSARQTDKIFPIRLAHKSIRRIEQAVGRAVSGHCPRRSSWGFETAPDFLTVVGDLSIFVLSHFGSVKHSPLCLNETNRFRDHAPIKCFTKAERGLTARTIHRELIDLSKAGSVGWRRSALFWISELMHRTTARSWLTVREKNNRSLRIEKIFARQNSAGMAWLADRVNHWPDKYRREWVWGTSIDNHSE